MNLWDKYNSVITILTEAGEVDKLSAIRHVTNLIEDGKIKLVDTDLNPINWKEQEFKEIDPEKVLIESIDGVFQLITIVVGSHYLTPENKALIKDTVEKDIEKAKGTQIMEYFVLGANISKLIHDSIEARAKDISGK